MKHIFNTQTSTSIIQESINTLLQSQRQMKAYGAQVYFAHPYSAWERPINERSNRILRRFMQRGNL